MNLQLTFSSPPWPKPVGRQQPRPLTRARAGFTLVELLVVMSILGILLALGSYGLVRQAQSATAVGYVEGLAQDINLARSVAMSKGRDTKVAFTSVAGATYTVTSTDPSTNAPVVLVVPKSASQVTLSGVMAGDSIICTFGGTCTAQDSAGTPKVISTITASAANTTRTLSITVLGLTRIE